MLIRQQYTVLFAHILLSWNSFTRKHFYTEALWHTVAGTFTCKYFYTAVFILRAFSLHTRMLCHRDAFDHTCSYTDIFTRGHLCTEKCLFLHKCFYRDMILHWAIWHRNQNKQRCFYKGMHVHEGFLATGIFTQTYYWIISCGGHAYGAKSSASICKISFTTAFDGRDAFRGKGLAQDNPTLQFDLMYDDRHFVRTGCVSWTSIHAALPLEEKS